MTEAAAEAMAAAEELENQRVLFWSLMPEAARVVVMLIARQPRARANEPLTSFTRVEREHIAMAVEVAVSHLEIASRCMRDTSAKHAVLLH